MNINLLYIDDRPEEALAKYLDREYSHAEHITQYSDIVFDPSNGYESLLVDPKVKSANVIIVDSRLFENRTATGGKFTGEEFKVVLKKFYPFIEVIVITQNGLDDSIEMLPKYDPESGQTSTEYYHSKLSPYINEAIANIEQYWLLAEKMKVNQSWETVLKDKVLAALNGINDYDELTKADIDNLILAFKEIQECLDE